MDPPVEPPRKSPRAERNSAWGSRSRGAQSRSPAAGDAQIKTGNWVVQDPSGQFLVLGNSLAGYAETKSGRLVAFMITTGNIPISTPEGFETITNDQARMVVAIQQDL